MDKLDDKNDRADYDNLLKRLEKPSSNFHASKTSSKITNDLRMQASTQKEETRKEIPDMSDTSDSGGAMQSGTAKAMPLSDQMVKQKSKRRLNNTMGGPVVSSGLSVKRDARTRHSTGRLSNSLTARHIGSLFGVEEENKETNSLHTQKQDALDSKVRRG